MYAIRSYYESGSHIPGVNAAGHHFGGDVEGFSVGVGVAERTGIGENGGIDAKRDIQRNRSLRGLDDAINQGAGSAGRFVDVINIAEIFRIGMMIDIDQAAAHGPQLITGPSQLTGVQHESDIKTVLRCQLVDQGFGAGKKAEITRNTILVVSHDLFARLPSYNFV